MNTSMQVVRKLRSWRMALASTLCLIMALVGAGWLMTPAQALGGDKAPSAKSILDKATVFHGGAKALGRELAIIRTEESDMVLDGEKIVLKCEWQFQPPDKRAVQSLVKIGTLQLNVRQAVVGNKGWVKIGPSVATDLSPAQAAGLSWEHDNHVKCVQMLASVERTHDIGTPQPIRIDNRDAWQISFADKQDKKRSFTAFFDKSTGQVLGDETERVVASFAANEAHEKPAKYRVLFHSFVDVDGIKTPDTFSIFREGKAIVEIRKSQVRVVDSIDPKVFIKPN